MSCVFDAMTLPMILLIADEMASSLPFADELPPMALSNPLSAEPDWLLEVVVVVLVVVLLVVVVVVVESFVLFPILLRMLSIVSPAELLLVAVVSVVVVLLLLPNNLPNSDSDCAVNELLVTNAIQAAKESFVIIFFIFLCD